ncbi:MAG: glycosyltransferase, partial [Gammaproteobacteria bacterium]|nr:glycosyltransferase [Gammaproteobacteria bacterium]
EQTYSSYEVIVVDDGSTDDTRTVLQAYKERIRYMYQDNQGQSATSNHGLRLAQGEFVVFLDADDFFLPDKLEEQVACFDMQRSLGMVHSGWRLVNQCGETIADVKPWHDSPHLDLETWVLWKPIFPGAIMFRREWLERVGGFDTQLRQAMDVDLILRLALMGCEAVWLHKPTICYRQHEGNITRAGVQQTESLEVVLDKFFTQPNLPDRIRRLEPKVRYYSLIWSAWHLYRTGSTDAIALYLQKSLRHTPYPPEATVSDWLKHCVKWALADGQQVDALSALWPHFKAATQFDDTEWTLIEKTLKTSLAKASSATVAPQVSVIIPAYNSASYLRQAVDSVLSQRDTSYELIIVDDGSTDDTRTVLQAYEDRIRYVYQDNQGVSAARNHGLRLAQGEFVVFLDADDFLLPNKLAEQVSHFEARPSLGIVHSGWRLVNQRAETVVDVIADVEPWTDAPRLDLETWLLWKPVFLGAMMFRRVWLDDAGGFDTRLRQAEDVDLVFRLALMGCKAAWVEKPTVCYRQHENSTMQNGLQQAEDLDAVMGKFFARTDMPDRIRRLENRVRYYTLMWIVWHLYRTGCTDYIAEYLRRTINYPFETAKITVFDWVGEFAKRLFLDGSEIGELRGMWPYFKAAAECDDDLWSQTERMLNWWIDVWWYYLQEDDTRAAQGLLSYRELAPRELVNLAQSALVMSPYPDTVQLAAQLWHDVREAQIIPESSHHEVASSQHEIDLRHTDALTMADTVMTCRLVVKEIAMKHGAYATFMP